MSRADEIARGLVAHLRGVLGEPGLELAEPPVPLTGGFDTEIHAVRLRGAPAAFAGPLVLRVLRAHHDPAMVMREQAIQNALADQGYPAARVLHATLDPAPLGAAFLLMERLPGTPLISTRPVGMDRPLLEAQLRLHALDPAPLARALGDASPSRATSRHSSAAGPGPGWPVWRSRCSGCTSIGRRRMRRR